MQTEKNYKSTRCWIPSSIEEVLPPSNVRWPLNIEIEQGTDKYPPTIRVGKWSMTKPFPLGLNGELALYRKNEILEVNGYKKLDHSDFILPRKWENSEERKKKIAAGVKAMHSRFADILGPKFNRRLHKFQRAAFFNPFHSRVTRLMGSGLRSYTTRSTGELNSAKNRQYIMSQETYRNYWLRRRQLNQMAEEQPNMLPFVMSLTDAYYKLYDIVGDDIMTVLHSNSARRNEDICDIIYRQLPAMDFNVRDDYLKNYHKQRTREFLLFLICLPSPILRGLTLYGRGKTISFMDQVESLGLKGAVEMAKKESALSNHPHYPF